MAGNHKYKEADSVNYVVDVSEVSSFVGRNEPYFGTYSLSLQVCNDYKMSFDIVNNNWLNFVPGFEYKREGEGPGGTL